MLRNSNTFKAPKPGEMKFIELTHVNGKIPIIINVSKIAYYHAMHASAGTFVETGDGTKESGITVFETVEEITKLIRGGAATERSWTIV